MKTLPEDFRTYTQALMGEKLYQRPEHAILEEDKTNQYPHQSF